MREVSPATVEFIWDFAVNDIRKVLTSTPDEAREYCNKLFQNMAPNPAIIRVNVLYTKTTGTC
ncbi:MAG: hypothetical protein JWQ09_4186 [Segetibacter sp.]|nr:hypothetical protein [Segetibacter sp.]